MKGRTCETVRDRLVDLDTGYLPALEAAETRAHLDGCDDCAAEATLVAELAGARKTAPEGFAQRVMAAHAGGEASRAVDRIPALGRANPHTGSAHGAARRAARGWMRPRRSLPLAAAAAGVVLAGALLVRSGAVPDDAGVMTEVADAGLNIVPWPGDDGVLAGAPALDALSIEELEALLEELDS